MNKYEKKIVLDYLHHINPQKGFLKKIISKSKAIILFNDMSLHDRKLILEKIVIDYLSLELSGSMTAFYVNGTPLKRLYRLREIAYYKYLNMNQEERDFIYKNILSN